jgi:regulator of cell morphogenesis and NO signaling
LDQLSGLTSDAEQPIQLIDQFFREYKKELEIHINREEDKVYPYIFMVENSFVNKEPHQLIVDKIREYSMDDFENEHDNVEDKLLDLKNLLIKYVPAPVDSNLSQAILFDLFRLETDLRDHARIEDKVLVPKVKFMEKWILDHYTA